LSFIEISRSSGRITKVPSMGSGISPPFASWT